MEKYIRDVHLYAGENNRQQSISVELFTLGDCFSVCVMQPGRNPMFVRELIRCFADCGIDCVVMSEEQFHLPDCAIL